ncbi:MAG: hypothetical protein MUP85_10670 [Candidatus Lokiarchaeota archaeon]|nr:hypothetical protein [Candidatus Lokiarchaeota archaeon]
MDEINEWLDSFGSENQDRIEFINLIKSSVSEIGLNSSMLNQFINSELSSVKSEFLDSLNIEEENED